MTQVFNSKGIPVVSNLGGGGGGADGVNIIAAGTQTADTTGTIVFSNSNGISFGMSGSTRVTASYTVPSTAGLISNVNVSAGTTSNNLSALTFSNSNGVSFGLDGSTITATVATNYQSAGAYLTTAMLSNAATISNLRVSAGTTSNLLSALTFSNSNGLSFGLNASTITGSYTVPSTAGLISGLGMSIGGNEFFLTDIFFSDANGIAWGMTASTLTASYTQSTHSHSTAPGAISAGTTQATSGTVIFSNSNGISFGLAGQTITGTVATNYQSQGAYLTTAMLSNAATISNLRVSAGTTSNLLSAITFSNANGLSFGLNGSTITGAYTVPEAGIQNINFSAGTTNSGALSIEFDDSNGISFGLSEDGLGGGLVTLTATVKTDYQTSGAYLTTAMQSNAATISNIRVSAGTTSNLLSAITFSNSNNVSFGLNGSTITATITVPAQSAQTVGLYASSNTYLTSSGTVDARSLSFRGDKSITVGISASEVVFSVGAYITTGMLSNAATISNVNLSAGTTSNNLSAMVFSNSNRVSFGLNGSTVTAKHALNFSAGTTSNEVSDQIVFSNSNGYSFGLNGSTITANGPGVGYLEPFPMTNTAIFGPGAGTWYFAPFVAPGSMSGGRINFLMQNTSTASLFRDIVGASYISSSTGGLSQVYTYSLAAALYSQGTGTNSTRLESAWSNSFSWGWSKSVSVGSSNVSQFSLTVAHSLSYISEIGSDGAYTLNQFNSNRNSAVANSTTNSDWGDSIAGSIRSMLSNSVIYPIGFNTTITAGNYWMAFAWSTTRGTSSTGNLGSALDFSQSSMLGISRLVLQTAYRNWGSTVTTARSGIAPYGLYTAAANMVPPANVAFSSDLSSIASAWVPYFNFQNQGITK